MGRRGGDSDALFANHCSYVRRFEFGLPDCGTRARGAGLQGHGDQQAVGDVGKLGDKPLDERAHPFGAEMSACGTEETID
jgi:hypothetical protein